MDDLYLSAVLDDQTTIFVSQVSARTYREAGGRGLGGDYGYFIYEANHTRPESGINFIAKAASVDAARRIFDLITCGSKSIVSAT